MNTPTLHINRPRVPDEQSLADRAYYAIREWIVTLDLPPGSVVNERELMGRLGVGRTPVREALRDLAREQLVEVFPRRGMFVSSVDVGDIAGLSEVRLLLESEAARLAAERRGDGDLEETDALLEELDAAAGERDARGLIDLDQRIHRHATRRAGGRAEAGRDSRRGGRRRTPCGRGPARDRGALVSRRPARPRPRGASDGFDRAGATR